MPSRFDEMFMPLLVVPLMDPTVNTSSFFPIEDFFPNR